MARIVSLHQLTALDATPGELVGIAARLRVESVCVFTHVPPAAAHVYPVVAPGDVPAMRDTLAAAGVRLGNLEVFPLDRDEPFDHLLEGLETGARLGANRATAHIHGTGSTAQAIDRFAAFAARAAGFGITAGLEFNAFSAVRTVQDAASIVRAAGRGAVVLDVLHLIRGGGGAGDVSPAADLIGYAQLSDGPSEIADDRRWHEAVAERTLPGEGQLPLAAIVRELAPAVIHDVEVPQSAARKAGVPAYERCRRAVDATRRLLSAVDEEVPA